jgi:hypothetical protein
MTMNKPDNEFEEFLSKRADVVIPLEREGPLSVTEVLATYSWFKDRLTALKSSGGRPTNPNWTIKRQIPLTPELWEKLKELASTCAKQGGVRVGPGQLASFLLEDAVVAVVAGDSPSWKARHLHRRETPDEFPQPKDARARAWEPQGPFFARAA